MKPSRNDPCPCGSGKKYKQCCLRENEAPTVAPKEHDDAAARAIEWLTERHRKAFGVAIRALLEDLMDEEDLSQLAQLDQGTWGGIQINLTEWLLAEGELLVKGARTRVSDYLLGSAGPLLKAGQRQWLQQLALRPLRLYDVTDVVPGVQATLCDALDTGAAPIVVRERSGTRTLAPGSQLGCRVMQVQEHFELSGAAYPFSMLAGPGVVADLRAASQEFGHDADLPGHLGLTIMSRWLQQFVAPPPMPTLIDAHSGEPLLLITDHYQVNNWDALTGALAVRSDVRGDRQQGWSRLIDCDDGQTRPIVTINLGKGAQRIEIFYKTQRYADQGRIWFDGLAGGAVKFLVRELSDPKALMTSAKSPVGRPAADAGAAGLDPQTLSQIIEAAIRQSYANWADEPVPALDNKTPRQAIKTAAGLERVKGLLRSYQFSEAQQAEQQGRPQVSYGFLWKAVGVTP